VAIVTWRAFRDVYNRINPRLFWACNLVPHFLVWSGSSSKEQIVIICGIIVIDFSTKYLFIARKLKIDILWVLISLWFIYFIRPNYFVIYCTIFLSSIFFSSASKTMTKRLSVGIWLMAYLIISLGLIIILLLDTKFISEDVVRYMKIVEGSFLAYDGGSNRTDIQWNNFTDFIYSAPWGILQGFIGPTLPEVIKKPLQFPVFIEGLVYLWILIYLFFKLFKLAGAINILRVQILPYMFIVLIVVLVSYPYLIFNPGSALRYKQSMHPILIFYPLLILAYARANNYMKTNARQKLFDRTRFIQ
jgi:hypothetical protein